MIGKMYHKIDVLEAITGANPDGEQVITSYTLILATFAAVTENTGSEVMTSNLKHGKQKVTFTVRHDATLFDNLNINAENDRTVSLVQYSGKLYDIHSVVQDGRRKYLTIETEQSTFGALGTNTVRGYGLIYNGHATVMRSFAPASWEVMAKTHWDALFADLQTIVGAASYEAGALKSTSDLWTTFNAVLLNKYNLADFNALPTGYRETDGTFVNRGTEGYWWYNLGDLPNQAAGLLMDVGLAANSGGGGVTKGFAVRMVYMGMGNPGTTLTDSDGNIYGVIKIGDKYYIDSDWRCTTFNNGDPIAKIQDAALWVAADGAAYCDYE